MPQYRDTDATPEAVWAVLSDGWQYGQWVVGASRIRAVERSWPEPGSRIHHSVGLWPALLNDETTSLAVHPQRELHLEARALPFGKAAVTIRLHPRPHGCCIEIIERALSFPANLVAYSIQDAAVHPRNVETLRRLALLAEHSSTP